VAELGDRLAHVCAVLAATVLADTVQSLATGEGPQPAEPETAPASEPGARAGATAGLLIDEREDLEPAIPTSAVPRESAPAVSGRHSRLPPYPWESPRAPAETSIAIRDERREDGPAAWIRSIERQLERFSNDGVPFAALLVEVSELERPGADARSALLGRVLERELDRYGGSGAARERPATSLTRERAGRYWLLAGGAGASAAQRLAESLVQAIRALSASQGQQPEVTVGVALCPDDGRDAATLAACADMGIYTARRAGRSVAPVDEPA